jgi:hypothetical protein
MFSCQNGLFIAPNGSDFIGRGVNMYAIDQWVTNAACQPLNPTQPVFPFTTVLNGMITPEDGLTGEATEFPCHTTVRLRKMPRRPTVGTPVKR